MPGFSTSFANEILDSVFGSGARSVFYLGALNSAGAEPSNSGYQRISVSNTPANFAAASAGVKTNANAIPFAEATAAWGAIASIGIFAAASGGAPLVTIPLAGKARTFIVSSSTGNLVLCSGHDIADGDRVQVLSSIGASIPSGLTGDAVYFARDVTPGASMRLSASAGGAAVSITSVGTGVIRKWFGANVAPGARLTIPAGAVSIGLE